MTDPPALRLATFRGAVACRRDAAALTLMGRDADRPDEALILTFIDPSFDSLPEVLTAPAVTALDERRYRILAPPHEWLIRARSAHLHRDVGTAFYRAIPPRTPPLKKRLFWRFVLTLARTRLGQRLLLSLRGK